MKRVRVLDTWERAIQIADTHAYQTGYRYSVRRAPDSRGWMVRRLSVKWPFHFRHTEIRPGTHVTTIVPGAQS